MAQLESGVQARGGKAARVLSDIPGRLPAGAPAAAFFVVLVLVLFSPSLLGGKVLSAGDLIWFQPPLSNDRPATVVRPSNGALPDPALVFHPDLWRAREAVRSGSAPLWNANIGAGRPLLASEQFAPVFPTQWLALVLPF